LSSTVPPDAPQSKAQLRAQFDEAQQRISEYQSKGTTQGQSVSSLIYALLSSLGREDNDSLWLGIIGWSSLPLNKMTNPEQLIWRDEVNRLNPPPLHTSQSVSDNSIRSVKDFPFPLLRHWSLYQSMLHSPYLCTRLRLYTAKGRTRLDHILAKMGIPKNHAKQAWTHTPRELKLSLKEKLERVETGQGLELVRGNSFERACGYKGIWSSNDVVHVIEAILIIVENSGKENLVPREEDPHERFRRREGEMKMEWVTKFWKALDSINKYLTLFCQESNLAWIC
jgi:cell division control protein 45